jgi:hypothetical protein
MGQEMTSERLRNRLAKVEGRSSPQSYVVCYEDGESAYDVHTRVVGVGRPVAFLDRLGIELAGIF